MTVASGRAVTPAFGTPPDCRVVITHHAIDRWIERVQPIDRISAREAMLSASRGIETAAAIGGHFVRMANGARLVVRGARHPRVVTVLGPEQHPFSRSGQ